VQLRVRVGLAAAFGLVCSQINLNSKPTGALDSRSNTFFLARSIGDHNRRLGRTVMQFPSSYRRRRCELKGRRYTREERLWQRRNKSFAKFTNFFGMNPDIFAPDVMVSKAVYSNCGKGLGR